MKFEGGEFSTGTMGNFQPELTLNPLLQGWGEYYKRAHVRKLFNQLDRWIVRRIWSQRFKRWRNGGWTQLPKATLYGEYELVNLMGLIPSLASRSVASS